MTAPAIKSVTKAVLSGFVRENSGLNLTQSKAISDRLLAEFIVTPKPPPDPSTFPVAPGQLWLHAPSNRVLRVSGVELGPMYVPGDPVTSWGPQRVSWEDADDGTVTGSTEIQPWREQTRPLSEADENLPAEAQTENPLPNPRQESETTP